jgi:diguanylate cyclase (GGDEF)-like protein
MATLSIRSRQLKRESTERAKLEAEAQELARHDALTGLFNRRFFGELIDASLKDAKASGSRLALLTIDLDRFKPVNDRYGHAVGDRVLQVAAQRIKAAVRSHDFVGRIGGDEFLVALRLDAEVGSADRVARRIVNALAAAIQVDDKEIHVSASVGIAEFPEDGEDKSDLLIHSDMAMYNAKAMGRNTFATYSHEIGAQQSNRACLERDIRNAIKNGEIVPFLQPQISLNKGKLNAFEVLARWQHAERGLVAPSEFIPTAEACGLISDLLISILENACRSVVGWPGEFKLSFNVSASQIGDQSLTDRIVAISRKTGFPLERLEAELTETVFVVDKSAATALIRKFHDVGISVALDDFGTGYSSLSYLAQLEIDKVKIDRSFMLDRSTNSRNEQIVDCILALGDRLNLVTTAEGVERSEDVAWLARRGCTEVQGYFFARPLSLLAAQSYLANGEWRVALEDAALPRGGSVLPLQPKVVWPVRG